MARTQKKYWIKYTQKDSFDKPKKHLEWFEFMENRDLLLKGILRSKNFEDIQFGNSFSQKNDDDFNAPVSKRQEQ